MKTAVFLGLFGTLIAGYGFAADSSRMIAFKKLYEGHSHGINANRVLANPFDLTPSQPEGPFYPRPLPVEQDADLTVINDGPVADGVIVQIQGTIKDLAGNAVFGAKVEIWQACGSGRYNHVSDTNPAPIDGKFQYYGFHTTDESGNYAFKIIVPGPYPAGDGWIRPPHVHYKIKAPGHKKLITQLYFDGASFNGTVCHLNAEPVDGKAIDSFNNADLILKSLPIDQKKRLIVRFAEHEGLKIGNFDIYLEKK
jgi:protocatechuate 3,4-dioxygenase beta subunit